MTLNMMVLAFAFIAHAPQWVACAGAESQVTQARVCAGADKATCEEENNVKDDEEASLLQVDIGAHSKANASKAPATDCPQQARFNIMMCNNIMCNECPSTYCMTTCNQIQKDFPDCRCANWPTSRTRYSD